MHHLIRPEVRALSAYRVPPSHGMIKLDAMENPYAWPGELTDAWLERLRAAQINRYPDPQATALKARLRESLSIPDQVRLMLGNGSDELIQLVALALAMPERSLLAPEPSFSMYQMIAAFTGMRYIGVPLREADFALDLNAMLAAIERHQPALIFIAYPNNPTGNLFDRDSVREIVAAAKGLVVIDEAYFAFSDSSFIDSFMDYENVVLMRTLSKLGLAGLRLGFLCGPEHWLDEIEKLRLPYNINTLTQISGEFALEHLDLLRDQAQLLRDARTQLYAALQELTAVKPFPSAANFILLRMPQGEGERIYQALLEAGILVKNLSASSAMLSDCLRVTVATPEQNRAFLQALQAAL